MPEGFKKVTEKTISFLPLLNDKIPIKKSYQDVYSILDSIFHEAFDLRLIEPSIHKTTTVRAIKPYVFANVKPKVMSEGLKRRSLSTVFDKKTFIPPNKMYYFC